MAGSGCDGFHRTGYRFPFFIPIHLEVVAPAVSVPSRLVFSLGKLAGDRRVAFQRHRGRQAGDGDDRTPLN
jgi:hypothetical protein